MLLPCVLSCWRWTQEPCPTLFSTLAESASHETGWKCQMLTLSGSPAARGGQASQFWLVWYNGKSVVIKNFLPWLEGEGNWEREAPLHLIKKLGDPTLLFLLLDIDVRGCDIWSCSSHLVTKRCPWQIRDSRLERQEAPKASIIAKPLKQLWYCLRPDFLMERKISPWEYLLPLVANVLFFSTSGHTGAQHFSATKVWLYDLKWCVTRVLYFVFSDWSLVLFPAVVIMGACTFVEVPKTQAAWNNELMPKKPLLWTVAWTLSWFCMSKK